MFKPKEEIQSSPRAPVVDINLVFLLHEFPVKSGFSLSGHVF